MTRFRAKQHIEWKQKLIIPGLGSVRRDETERRTLETVSAGLH